MPLTSPIHQNGELWPTALVILSSILYGFLGYFGASLLNLHFSIAAMLFWRFAIASLCILLITLQRKVRFCDSKNPFISKKINSSSYLLLLSAIAYCAACTFYFMASKLTGTGIAMVIYFIYPLFVVFFDMLQKKEWVDKNTMISLLILMLGLFLLKNKNEHHVMSLQGVVYALMSAFFFACYVFTCKSMSNKLSSHFLTFILCLSNACFFLIYALATHTLLFPSSIKMWLFIFGLGIIATALPVQLMLEGLKSISASKAAILSVLEPAVTLFVGMLLLSEQVGNLQIIGTLVILFSAIYIQSTTKKIAPKNITYSEGPLR